MNFIIRLILNAIAVVLTAFLLKDGVHLDGFGTAVILAALLVVLNVSVKPVLIFLTIPATILTLGLFLLVINAIIILIADWIIPSGFEVKSFWWALLFSLVLSLVNSIFERLTVKKEHRSDSFQIYDKDGKRII
ncbi:MAG: phage holin family protein [Chitinophagales bacterium]|nr:phage holin family protein [Chitinophagales bacterium]MDW8418110.1 phage holin family protein [Chitinophagales bacterium]